MRVYSIRNSFWPSAVFSEEIKIIVYLDIKNIQKTGTQGPLKWLLCVLEKKQETYENLGENV
jgi:hypothetical protein